MADLPLKCFRGSVRRRYRYGCRRILNSPRFLELRQLREAIIQLLGELLAVLERDDETVLEASRWLGSEEKCELWSNFEKVADLLAAEGGDEQIDERSTRLQIGELMEQRAALLEPEAMTAGVFEEMRSWLSKEHGG